MSQLVPSPATKSCGLGWSGSSGCLCGSGRGPSPNVLWHRVENLPVPVEKGLSVCRAICLDKHFGYSIPSLLHHDLNSYEQVGMLVTAAERVSVLAVVLQHSWLEWCRSRPLPSELRWLLPVFWLVWRSGSNEGDQAFSLDGPYGGTRLMTPR